MTDPLAHPYGYEYNAATDAIVPTARLLAFKLNIRKAAATLTPTSATTLTEEKGDESLN